MDIRQRLHLSGMDSHAPELARKWGLGLEVTDFCYAPMLDDPATLPAVREKMAGIDHFWLHAPFAELAPCAVDPLVREVKARGAVVLGITVRGKEEALKQETDYQFCVPDITDFMLPSLSILPLQLFAYYVASMKGCDIDKPRNLAKSVTVE